MTWDESLHPRHPEGSAQGGQFAPKGGTSEAARSGAGLKTHKAAREEQYRKFHERTLEAAKTHGREELNYEMGWGITPEGEDLGAVGQARGNLQLSLALYDTDRMEGNFLIHNHPGLAVGFSRADLFLAAKHDMKGIVATVPDGAYVLEINRPADAGPGWGLKLAQDMTADYSYYYDNVFAPMFRRAIMSGDMGSVKATASTIHGIMETLDKHDDYGEFIDYEFIYWED